MKKLLLILLCAAMCLSLFACNQAEATETGVPTDATVFDDTESEETIEKKQAPLYAYTCYECDHYNEVASLDESARGEEIVVNFQCEYCGNYSVEFKYLIVKDEHVKCNVVDNKLKFESGVYQIRFTDFGSLSYIPGKAGSSTDQIKSPDYLNVVYRGCNDYTVYRTAELSEFVAFFESLELTEKYEASEVIENNDGLFNHSVPVDIFMKDSTSVTVKLDFVFGTISVNDVKYDISDRLDELKALVVKTLPFEITYTPEQ